MATLDTLVQRGDLVRIIVHLSKHEFAERQIFGFPGFVTWMQNDLPNLNVGRLQAVDTPLAQADALLHAWLSGKRIRYGKMFQDLMPQRDEVWELKTADLRIFGWMCKPKTFIALFGDYADLYKPPNQRRSYSEAIERVKASRASLDLDEPKYATGMTFDELVSV